MCETERAKLDAIEITPEMIEALRRGDLVLAPAVPTPAMIESAKESAWAEDAEGVWRDMIATLTG